MAGKPNGKATQMQAFMKDQIEEAQKRILAIEGEARRALKSLMVKGRESRKELSVLLKRFNAKDLKFLGNPTVKALSKRAEAAGSQMAKRLDSLQTRLIQVSGVASQAQIRELNREIHRLSKKVDGLIDKRKNGEARA